MTVLMDQLLANLWTVSAALGQAAPAGEAAPPGAPGAGDFRPMLFMFVALGLLFYFIVLRPQKADTKKREDMINAVGKGDAVVTIGGVHGKVESVDLSKAIVAIEVAPKVTLRVNKSALASVTPKGKKTATETAPKLGGGKK